MKASTCMQQIIMETNPKLPASPLPKTVIRYYAFLQCSSHPPRTVLYLLQAISALQMATLMLPPTSKDGFPWDYTTLWPLWYVLNSPARPDRMLELAGVARHRIVYACIAFLGVRVSSFTVVCSYFRRLSRRRFLRLLRTQSHPRWVMRCVLRSDRFFALLLSRVFSVPAISFLVHSAVAPLQPLNTEEKALIAFGLPALFAIILFERVSQCDLQYTAESEGPKQPSYALLFSVCDLAATVFVPLYVSTGHDFLLRSLVAACGLVKAGYIFVSLPFHNLRLNALKSFEGVLLIWQSLLLTVAFNSLAAPMTISLCAILVSPALFYINRSLIIYLLARVSSERTIYSELEFDYAVRRLMQHKKPCDTEEPPLDTEKDDRVKALWARRLDLYPLLWSAYCSLHRGDIYCMRIFIARICEKQLNFLSCIPTRVCIIRLRMHIEATHEEEVIQNFLKLHRTQEKMTELDTHLCHMLREFYLNLRMTNSVHSVLVAQIHRLQNELQTVLRFYKKAVTRFSKNITLLQAYGGLLMILGKKKKAESLKLRALSILQEKRRERPTGLNLLLNDHSKCLILVVPLSGPHSMQIATSMNAAILDHRDDCMRGMSLNILVPKTFREMHLKSLTGILNRIEEPQIFRHPFKMYLVDAHGNLLFGAWQVFATNIHPEGHLTAVVTVRIEPPPREFAILSEDNHLMEMTNEFSRFLKCNSKVKLDLSGTEVVWTGMWENNRMLISKESWELFGKFSIPIIALNKLRGRAGSRQGANTTLGNERRLSIGRKVSFGQLDNTEQLFSRMSRKSSSHTSNFGSSFTTVDEYVTARTHHVLRKYALFTWLIALGLLLVMLLTIAVSVTVLVSAVNAIETLNDNLSEMNSIGIRRFLGVTSALRSKELYMINGGLTVIGNETRSRADLMTVSNMMKQMSLNVLGNVSQATGYYRHLVVDPSLPFWRFEGGDYHLYHVTLIDQMKLLSDHAKALNATSLRNVTADNVHFRTLYRNGAAETLQSFNHTIDAYTDNMQFIRFQETAHIETIVIVSLIVEIALGTALSCPLLYLLERQRKKLWRAIMQLPKPLFTQALSLISERFNLVDEAAESFQTDDAPVRAVNPKAHDYKMSGVLKALTVGICCFLAFSSLYILHVYFTGINQATTILDHKPLVINWSGLRRAITQFTVFNMREAWLFNSNSSYLSLVPEHQYRFNPLIHMERGFLELEYIHKSLIYGNTPANTSHLGPSNAHKDLLFSSPCNGTCDPLLQKGLAPLVNEVLISFRGVRSALLRGESDYTSIGGKKTEKAVATLMPYLSTLVQQYDTDTLLDLEAIKSNTKLLCLLYIMATVLAYVVLLLPLLLWVCATQHYASFAKEVKILKYMPHETLADVLAKDGF